MTLKLRKSPQTGRKAHNASTTNGSSSGSTSSRSSPRSPTQQKLSRAEMDSCMDSKDLLHTESAGIEHVSTGGGANHTHNNAESVGMGTSPSGGGALQWETHTQALAGVWVRGYTHNMFLETACLCALPRVASVHVRARTHTRTPTRTHARECMMRDRMAGTTCGVDKRVSTRSRAHVHEHTNTRAHEHTHGCRPTSACININAHTHTHTHTHTYRGRCHCTREQHCSLPHARARRP